MKSPREYTNDELAIHLELWVALNEELTERQKDFFEEFVWRLRLTPDLETCIGDSEKENVNE